MRSGLLQVRSPGIRDVRTEQYSIQYMSHQHVALRSLHNPLSSVQRPHGVQVLHVGLATGGGSESLLSTTPCWSFVGQLLFAEQPTLHWSFLASSNSHSVIPNISVARARILAARHCCRQNEVQGTEGAKL